MARSVETVFSLRTDKKTIQDAVRNIDSVKASLVDMANSGKIDDATFAKAATSLKALDARAKVLTGELAKASEEMEGLEGEELDKARAKVTKLEKSVSDLGAKSLAIQNQQEKAITRQEAAIRAKVEQEERFLRQQQEEIEKQQRLNRISEQYDVGRSSAQRRFAAYGDLDTGFQTIGNTLGGSTGDTLRAVGDLSAVTEQIGLMGEAAVSTAKGVTASTGALGKVAQFALGTVPALGAAGAGFLAIGGAVAAVAVAAAPLVIGLKMISDRAKEAARNAERMAKAVVTQSEATAEVQAAIWNDDIEAAIATADRLNEERIRLLLQKGDLERRIAQLDGKDKEKTQEELSKVRDEMVNVTLASKAAEEALAPYADEVERIRYANSEAGQAEKELADKREQAAQTIAQLDQRESDLRRQRAQALADLAEDRAVRDAREREDFEEQVAKSQKRIEEVQIESSKRIADIRVDAAKQEISITKKTQESIADTASSASKSIAEIQTKTQEDSAKSYAKYLKDRRRAEEDYQDQSFNAIINNDVLALKQAQSARQKDRQRAQEDFDEEAIERRTESAKRIAEIRDESAIRIAEIKANGLIERKELAISLRERIAGEQEAVKERLKAEEEAAEEQERAREKRLERQREDDERADERSRRAHEEELARIDAEQQAQQDALQAMQRGATTVITAVGQSSNAVINTVSAVTAQAVSNMVKAGGNAFLLPKINVPKQVVTSSAPAKSTSSTGGTNSRPSTTRFTPEVAFAAGGIVPKGRYVEATFESQRNYDEVVLPLNRQTLERVLPDGFTSGPSVTYGDIHIGAGNNVTREDVRNIMFEVVGAQMRGIQRARTGA